MSALTVLEKRGALIRAQAAIALLSTISRSIPLASRDGTEQYH
jgi:hypothetical protein